jgi:tetratricopeptide (TPR) repeat protein
MIRRMLLPLLLLVPGVANADWYEASTRHFVVYSDQRPERLEEFAANLERFDHAVRRYGGWKDDPVAAPNRVTVYVVDNRETVSKLARSRFVAGFYRPRAGGSLAVVPRRSGSGSEFDLDGQSILFHEYAHHLMWSIAPHAVHPAWFIEGFAELFATADFEKDGAVRIGAPPLYRARTLLTGNNLPIDKMLVADTLKLSNEQRDALYGRGWLLTHYLLVARQRGAQLTQYLGSMNAGKTSLEAAQAFGDLRKFDSELERYKRGKLIGYRVAAADAGQIKVALRKLTEGEAATMDVRIRSKNGVNARTAPDVYADARKAAARFPNDPGAQIVLAEAAFDAGDLAAAEAAADRAIAASPKATDALLYKAMARMELARKAGDKSNATLTDIRKIIAQANRLEQEDPKLLILYYRSFVDFGLAPTENARLGLARAFELAPQDVGLRFNAATMFLRAGNKAEARAMLAPLAYSPHGQGFAKRAAELIATIDKGDDKAAIKAIEGAPATAEGEDEDEPTGK